MNFGEFFEKATSGNKPYPYQEALASASELPELLSIPTGLGKTAAIILGWLFRRRYHPQVEIRHSTPRRLVYCFPMRVLVEQTHGVTQNWLNNLGLDNDIKAHLLMGGADRSNWDEHPENDAILIGTQDMLLSRALNRGYGMSRYRWPIHFGLLNNDSLWVMDETQLMGVGLTTTAQLQGLRHKLPTYGAIHSIWMSATLDPSPIRTVDHTEPEGGYRRHALAESDLQTQQVRQRVNSSKPIGKCKIVLSSESEKKGYAKELATVIKQENESQAGQLILVVLNRVARAQEVFAALQKLYQKSDSVPEIALVHSRFRPCDRQRQEECLFRENIPSSGRIVIATQAIEAGVDVSAAVLFTELAPWPSLVQRFGRCNRRGDITNAKVFWIDTQSKDEKDKVLPPYKRADLEQSREYLQNLSDAGPNSLKATQKLYEDSCEAPVVHTLRRKDLLDLWDTTPDLAGNDLDVSRFIRDSEDTDVQFYWRDLDVDVPAMAIPAPVRSELCAVSIARARDFLTKLKKNKGQLACIWKPLDKQWQQIDPDDIRSGMVLLIRPTMGGYSDQVGWTGETTDKPTPHPPPPDSPPDEANDDEGLSNAAEWMSIPTHLSLVATAVEKLRDTQSGWESSFPWEPLINAARWHDVGKAHPAFQNMLLNGDSDADSRRHTLWAKSGTSTNVKAATYKRAEYWVDDPSGSNSRQDRTGFRHELASALVWLQHRGKEADANLVAFLIASHHGKIRVSIRSFPNERPPDGPEFMFARGIWHGDVLPDVDLGNGEIVHSGPLDLNLMKLGTGEHGESWLSRVLELRDDTKRFGPFRLSFLESLLRIADWRGTQAGDR